MDLCINDRESFITVTRGASVDWKSKQLLPREFDFRDTSASFQFVVLLNREMEGKCLHVPFEYRVQV